MICAAPLAKGPQQGQPATGTAAGYFRHYRASEPPCDACLLARRSLNNEREKRRYRGLTEADKERRLQQVKRWANSNPAKVAQYKRLYKQRNPDMALRHVHRRRARLLNTLSIPFTSAKLEARLSMFAGCWMCGGAADCVDHVKPLAKGGADTLANLRPACTPCNASKGSAWPLRRVNHHE